MGYKSIIKWASRRPKADRQVSKLLLARRPVQILQRNLRLVRMLVMHIFSLLNAVGSKVAVRIADVDLEFCLSRDTFDVFSLRPVGLRMCDDGCVLWSDVNVVVVVAHCLLVE